MSSNLPSTGVKLGRAPAALGDDKHVKQVFRLSFKDADLIGELLKSNAPIKLSTGKNKTLSCGKLTYHLTPSSGTSYRSEVYQRDGRNFKCVGLATHSFTVADKSRPSDEAADQLAAQFSALKQQKLAKQTKAVSLSEMKVTAGSNQKYSKFSLKASRPTGRTQDISDSIPKPQLVKKKRKEVSDGELGLKKVLMHLLAAGPDSEKNLAQTVRSTPQFCNDVILRHKIANRNAIGTQWVLVDDFYKEMDLYAFPYDDDKRKAALDRALDAFERLRVPDDSEVRQLLLSPEDRGKATPPTKTKPKSPPKITISEIKGTSSAQPSPTFPKNNGGEPMARSVSQPVPKKKVQDPISRMIANKGKPPKVAAPKGRPPKDPSKPKESTPKAAPKKATTKTPAVPPAKIKSAEFIEDSDEDAFQTSPKPQPAAPASTSSRSSSSRMDSDVEMRDVPPSKKLSPVKRKISPAPKSLSTAGTSGSPAVRTSNATPRQKQPAATNGKISKPVSKTSAQANGIKRKSPPEPSRYSPPESVSKPSPLGQSNVSAADVVSSPSSISSSPALTTSTRTASPYDSARQKYTSSAPTERKRKFEGSSASSGPGKAAKRPKFKIDDKTMEQAKYFKEQHPRYLRKYEIASRIKDPQLREEKMTAAIEMGEKLRVLKENIVKATMEQQRAYELSIRG